MHNCALKTPLYPSFALPWRCDIMEYSSIVEAKKAQSDNWIDLEAVGGVEDKGQKLISNR